MDLFIIQDFLHEVTLHTENAVKTNIAIE